MLCLSSFIFFVILVLVYNLDYVYFEVLTKFTSETDNSFFIEMYIHQCSVALYYFSIAAVANNRKRSSLKQHSFIISQFCRSKFHAGSAMSPA